MLPYIFLSIPAGIITDRFDRRYVLLVSDLARAACMVVLAFLVASDGPLWAITVVAMLAACFSTFFYPAIGALLPSLVRDEREFGPANSAWATLDNFAWIVGPGIAGLLLATGDIAPRVRPQRRLVPAHRRDPVDAAGVEAEPGSAGARPR